MLAAETQAQTSTAEGGSVPLGLQLETPAADSFTSPPSHHVDNSNTFDSQSRDYNDSMDASGVSQRRISGGLAEINLVPDEAADAPLSNNQK